MSSPFRTAYALVFALVISSFSFNASANEQTTKLKAAWLFQLHKYLHWTPKKPTVAICLMGGMSYQVAQELEAQKSAKNIGSYSINNVESLQEAARDNCDVLYIEDDDINPALVTDLPRSMFTVGYKSNMLSKGLILSIEITPKPIFTISKSNLLSSSVEVHSKFLSIATIVE